MNGRIEREILISFMVHLLGERLSTSPRGCSQLGRAAVSIWSPVGSRTPLEALPRGATSLSARRTEETTKGACGVGLAESCRDAEVNLLERGRDKINNSDILNSLYLG